MAPGNVARAEEHFRGLGIQVMTGHWYLGGFLGDMLAEREWLGKKIQGWKESVAILAGVSLKHPRFAYAGLQNSLQQEWAFVQRVTPLQGSPSAQNPTPVGGNFAVLHRQTTGS